WRSLRTNNPLERLLREVRRRTRAVGAFPDGKSALMLAAARLRHVAGSKWGTRRYMDMNRLAEASEAAGRRPRQFSAPPRMSRAPQQDLRFNKYYKNHGHYLR